MSGVEIILDLLSADAAVTAVVPEDRIMGGGLPEGIPLPALLVTTVSSRPNARLAGRASHWFERVQVTIRAANYEQTKTLGVLIGDACDGLSGVVVGRSGVAITALGPGPDFRTPDSSIWMSSIDFRVSYPAA
jgi:hypothetical protein